MYFGIFLIGLGVVLAVFKWWAAAVFMAIFVIRYITLIYKEERRLAIVFPRSYKDYCKKVPRILPSLPAMMEMDISEYLPVRLSWFKKEIGAILVVLFLTLLVESWEEVVRGGFWGYVRQSSWLFLVFILFMAFIVLLSKWTDKNYGNGTVKG
jgi:protein-S-isoprenylcysteine O-methyltransferase Ste14